MTKYIALLRGIGPGNPNMRNDKLRGVFEAMGFQHVSSVLSSGNIVFVSDRTDTKALEQEIDETLTQHLGISSRVIIRSEEEIQAVIDGQPFATMQHSKETYLTLTFMQQTPDDSNVVYENEKKSFRVLGLNKKGQAVYAVTDTNVTKGAEFMQWLEKRFGKSITTRTWATVLRIAAAFSKI